MRRRLPGPGGTGGLSASAEPIARDPTGGQAASATRRFTLRKRASGVLIHPTSLPGPYGCGDVGRGARELIDFLASAGQRWWQMLPVTPVGPGDCPYNSPSAFAVSPLLIDLDALQEAGMLRARELTPVPGLTADRVDYERTTAFRESRLRLAFERRARESDEDEESEESGWLDEYALYRAIKRAHGGRPWWEWTPALRKRKATAMRVARRELGQEVAFHRFCQRTIGRQWQTMRAYARQQGVGLIGDAPIYVNLDSADVWVHRDLFMLDARGRAAYVSGVPGDGFGPEGQKWGHPLYRWARHERTDFSWWISRLARTFEMFDAVRIDHFLGLTRYWRVPAGAATARRGRWDRAPGAALLAAARRALGHVEVFAEDLGPPYAPARALLARFDIPVMRVLEQAFGSDRSEHQPHLFPRRCAAYTSTHDHDTIMGWYERMEQARAKHAQERGRLSRWLSMEDVGAGVSQWTMVRMVLASAADTAIIPAQDLLGLPSAARMNIPGTPHGNWRWRMEAGALDVGIARRLGDLARYFGRGGRMFV